MINEEQISLFDLEDIAIKGTLVKARIGISKLQQLQQDPGDFEMFIKQRLATMIAEELIKNKHISFTKYENINDDTTSYIARASIVPADITQLLRKQVKL